MLLGCYNKHSLRIIYSPAFCLMPLRLKYISVEFKFYPGIALATTLLQLVWYGLVTSCSNKTITYAYFFLTFLTDVTRIRDIRPNDNSQGRKKGENGVIFLALSTYARFGVTSTILVYNIQYAST